MSDHLYSAVHASPKRNFHARQGRRVAATRTVSESIALTLRRTLLLVIVLVGLLPCAALSWLTFSRTRTAMTQQIQQTLSVQARSIQSDIDQMLFERFENVLVWSRSELMQDLRFGDVDKRATNYLVGLQSGYGDVYDSMECLAPTGAVIASSVAAHIGTRRDAMQPNLISLVAQLNGSDATLSLPQMTILDDNASIAIETAIRSPYDNPANPASRLRLALSAKSISRMLDAAEFGQRAILVLDGQGRWVAGSSRLRGRHLPDAQQQRVGQTVSRAVDSGIVEQAPWLDAPALTGRGHSRPTQSFAGTGWTTVVFEPVEAALAPVSEMAAIFAGLLGAVLIATLLAANAIAAAIARPIIALTERTRRHQRGVPSIATPPARSRIAELDVLTQAYDEMVHAVEHSRQELVRTSKMAMLGELAGVLAHEVRTPLGILRSSAQVLMRNPRLDADGLELMRFIESETERLNRLVSTMLDTARPRHPDLKPTDLHGLLRRCAQMHELKREDRAPGKPIVLALDADDPVVHVDAEQIMQVFFNLLSNAAEAAGDAGTVQLTTHDGGAFLCLRCEDSGAGIPPELRDKMFDPFVSGRSGGFGLGLAVVRQVVSAHGGQIDVATSRLGGAAIIVRLPRPGCPSSGLST